MKSLISFGKQKSLRKWRCRTAEEQERFFGTRWAATVTRTQGILIPAKSDPKREAIEQILWDSGKWDEVSSLDTVALKKLLSQNGLGEELIKQMEPLIEKTTGIRFNISAIKDEESQEV